MKIKSILAAAMLCVASVVNAQDAAKKPATTPPVIPGRWTMEKANAWYAQYPWMSGANYIPANAINQLEMWQADTFDPATIDKEFGWAEGIGFNLMRVFLHSQAWKADAPGFKKRINQFLTIADKHHIKIMFVFFDDCWNAGAKPGKQPEPKVGVHNSGWMQDPGFIVKKPEDFAYLKKYVTDILTTFKADKRILLWDLYNEPGNRDKGNQSMELLVEVFKWARAVNPSQPISAGMWKWELYELNAFQANNSDVVTYHNYKPLENHEFMVKILKFNARPLICTEYMARTHNSTFETVTPMLKEQNVAAINWGFVAGKTNTIYSWEKPMPDGSEPELWFHDIFRKDGTPYKQAELDLIKKLNGK
ncbi:cellulase family glycosylhydrolase [Mucilaginibacter sp. JRF]|uniref:glycoside hydrolase family 2 TIM barrel-domain containing protein n=1 Tax=Mucilaginibacter sp. JRF TaxID=2780088 RepID=UPI00187EB11D|nr:glycoside hydrolase family 2 TIM barrel-domain containing protein [Mucilaginibacter sp. JRF]MBE9582957.1 cellulase family glycosylhydrolase [Mucilaginibacter sp. JRF]